MIALLSSALLGALLGVGAANAPFLGWWTLLVWGIAAVGLGALLPRRSRVAGALYGFVLCFTFMLAGYTGKSSLLSRLPFFSIFGIVGAICGLLLAVVGARLARRVVRARDR